MEKGGKGGGLREGLYATHTRFGGKTYIQNSLHVGKGLGGKKNERFNETRQILL